MCRDTLWWPWCGRRPRLRADWHTQPVSFNVKGHMPAMRACSKDICVPLRNDKQLMLSRRLACQHDVHRYSAFLGAATKHYNHSPHACIDASCRTLGVWSQARPPDMMCIAFAIAWFAGETRELSTAAMLTCRGMRSSTCSNHSRWEGLHGAACYKSLKGH